MTRRRRIPGVEKRVKPQPLGRVVADFLEGKGLAERVNQTTVIDDWASVVGPQIAAVTEAKSITPDGTLLVAVKTNAWMTELSLLEPELVRALNSRVSARRVRKIRFQLSR